MSNLTTHVLDTSMGKPADGLRVVLFKKNNYGNFKEITSSVTNKDGRIKDSFFNEGDKYIGEYEFNFHVGEYFDNKNIELPEIKFLDIVVIRFGISSEDEHYHVPLLLSPFGYSTYRGS